jgi:flagellar basal body rod protein FlgC
MYDQSITGIRSNLDAFSQAASRIGRTQATDEVPAQEDRTQAVSGTGPRLSVNALKNQQVAANQTTASADETAKAHAAYRKASNSANSVRESSASADSTGDANESAKEPAAGKSAAPPVDEIQEMVNMIVAGRGVEANINALKSAESLFGQKVDIKA